MLEHSNLTYLHTWVGTVFDMRVVFIKMTRILSHLVFQVFFLANDEYAAIVLTSENICLVIPV